VGRSQGMDDKTQIAHLFERHGEVVVPDDFDGPLATGLREQLEVYHTFAGDVDCVFLANLTFNAVATSEGPRYAIGINIGAALLIARYAYCLMSDPVMFPNVGDPSREEVDPYVVASLREPLGTKSYGRYQPRDPTRLEAAKQLSLAAYLVLFFHELNHVELGHLDFVSNQLGVTEYRELPAVPLTTDNAAVRRALELEADMAALYRSLRVWRTLYPLFDHPALATMTPEDSWFLAVELLFWIMDFVQPKAHVGLLATHPSPIARRMNTQEVTSTADWVATMDDTSPLIPWIARSKFPSAAFRDPLYGNPDRIKRELAETNHQLVALLPVLDSYRRFPSERR
jgi:hypothetical protein